MVYDGAGIAKALPVSRNGFRYPIAHAPKKGGGRLERTGRSHVHRGVSASRARDLVRRKDRPKSNGVIA